MVGEDSISWNPTACLRICLQPPCVEARIFEWRGYSRSRTKVTGSSTETLHLQNKFPNESLKSEL